MVWQEWRVFAYCLRYCKVNLAPPNAIAWLVEAASYSLDELRDVASAYVAHNMRRIRMVARSSIQQLSEHPELMMDVISQSAA